MVGRDFFTSFFISEQGQSLVIIALLFAFAFLALAALAIDGTIINLRRRELQNAADAAALSAAVALSHGKSDNEAYQAAQSNITQNDGTLDWYSDNGVLQTSSDLSGNNGSGAGMTIGIEITGGCDVRVALQWQDIGTYFAQFIGRGTLQVGAKARAACNHSGGLQPIAVKRFGDQFDWDESNGLNTNNVSVYCEDCDTTQSIVGQGKDNAYDFLMPEGSDQISEWPGFGTDPSLIYQPPSPFADLKSGTPGREYFILGAGADPNVGTGAAYAGLINLDIRHLSAPPREYYNGISAGQPNVYKDLAENYIREGYCCDIPSPGDEVAVLDGVNTSFAPTAFRETYELGEIIAVIVYDGHVLKTPNLFITGDTPNSKSTYPISTTTSALANAALDYPIDLSADSGFASHTSGLVMNVEGLNGFANWSFSPTSRPVLGGTSNIFNKSLTLHLTPTVTTVGTTTHVITGTRMFYVSAIDTYGQGSERYWVGVVTVGDDVNGVLYEKPSVTAQLETPFMNVVKGDPSSAQRLDLQVWGVSNNQTVTVNGTLPTGFSLKRGNTNLPWTVNTSPSGTSFNIKLAVDNTATAGRHTIPLTVSAPGMETLTFNLYVLVENTSSSAVDYVRILGYAALEITDYPGVNAVKGRIVSELLSDPSDLTYGLKPRLIPWNQP